MIQTGIINPHLLDLVARIRHTNTIVIADWAFPSWPGVETVDLSIIKGVPTIINVLDALQPNFKVGCIWQASEFIDVNSTAEILRFDTAFLGFAGAEVRRIPHADFKSMVPRTIGLIRTGDPTGYGNVILESV